MLIAESVAQAAGDGTAAWVTAVGSTTALGALLMVLRWLAWTHLPAKDAQLKELLGAKDAQIDRQRGEFTATLGGLVETFRVESEAERTACERRQKELVDAMTAGFKLHLSQADLHQAMVLEDNHANPARRGLSGRADEHGPRAG